MVASQKENGWKNIGSQKENGWINIGFWKTLKR